MIKIELELLADVEIILDLENGFKEGIARTVTIVKQIINRCINMIKQKKVHLFNNLMSRTNSDGVYHNQLLTVDLDTVKVFRCLDMALL